MDGRLLSDVNGLRTFAVVFAAGDEVAEGLLAFARRQRVSTASFTGIGALEALTVGYLEVQRRDYKRIRIAEQVEVLALAGNVAVTDEGPQIHAHLVVGRSDGSAHGGHLLEARVRPTLEWIVTETPAHLQRRSDPRTGLALIAQDASVLNRTGWHSTLNRSAAAEAAPARGRAAIGPGGGGPHAVQGLRRTAGSRRA